MREHSRRITTWARWLATFIGFPAAGVAARLAVGNIDDAGSAVVGGLVAGATLGVVQAVIGGIAAGDRARWVAATAVGLASGLTAGAATVGYRTDVASLVAMGAITGVGVGLAQAMAVRMRAVDRLLWIVATPLLWAGGWLITSQVINDAERQHAVFGSSGAIVVAALAGVLVDVRGRGPAHTETAVDVGTPAGSMVGAS